MSKGEDKIAQILRQNHIEFKQEKSFKDLKQGIFRFDFFCPNVNGAQVVIEYNGEQHYYPIQRFFKNRHEFLHQQNNDRRKISYCLANNIIIYCIPFWELSNINSLADIFDSRFRATSRWKNDDDWATYSQCNRKK